MKKDYIPRRNSDLNSFEENFLKKLGLHSKELKLRPAETESPVKIIEANRKAFSKIIRLKTDYAAACEEYKAARKKSIAEMRRLSNMIRSSGTFTRMHGADLGILNPKNKFQGDSDRKPSLKLKVDSGRVIIKYIKHGTEGLILYSKTGKETKFNYLTHVMRNSYTDKRSKSDRSQPEVREYYGIYIKDNKETGKHSDTVRVVIP